MDAIYNTRELAKDDNWQNLYILAKDMGSIKLFDNVNDFTYIQNIFLRYLNFYYTIYSDIAIGDVDELVLENHVYEDSYMMWKNRKDKEQFKNKEKPKNTTDINSLQGSKWIFKNPNKVK